MPEELRVGIITDWNRCYRGNEWPNLLQELGARGLACKASLYPIGDLVIEPVQTANPASTHGIRDLDVLIVNWDAANGDPDFGAHLTMRWLEHRRPELLAWVRRGKLLIIESQTILGAPSQPAYDAVAGPGELPVCGPEDRLDPRMQNVRVGAQCKPTGKFPKTDLFAQVGTPLRVNNQPTHEMMFPGNTDKFIIVDIKARDYTRILYRGWFRRSLPWARGLPWVSILQTDPSGADDRQTRWRHSTMQVARVGEGAIFATTMLLATTRQVELVHAILACAKGQTKTLPTPPSLVASLQGVVKAAALFASGTAVAFLTNLVTPWLHLATAATGFGPATLNPKDVASQLWSLAVGAAVVGGYALYRAGRKAVRNFMGY